jgi:hypothetical protein
VSAKRKPLDFKEPLIPAVAAEPTPALVVTAKPQEVRKQVGARIPAALYRRLKSHAALEGKLVQELVEQAIDEFLNRRA